MILQFLKTLGEHGKILELLFIQQLDTNDQEISIKATGTTSSTTTTAAAATGASSTSLVSSISATSSASSNTTSSSSSLSIIGRRGSLSTKNLKIWKTATDVLANQLALIEFDLFRSIKNHELSEGGWKRRDGDKVAPNLLRSIRRFGEVSAWVASEIILAKKSSSRVKRVHQSIMLAKV
jgi:hypothetical protein